MAKVYGYMILLSGIMALMDMAGVPTASSQILTAFSYRDLSLITSSSAITLIATIFSLFAVVTGIVVGFLTQRSTETIAVSTLAGLLLVWGLADLGSIISYFKAQEVSFIGNVVTLIFFPLMVGYAIAVIQWWRGNDI